jgi:lipoprotein-anchoring transpeptidase ErfK/SrfK
MNTRTRRKLTSVFCAAGVVAAMATVTPSALADPEGDPGAPPPPPAVDAPPPPAPVALPVQLPNPLAPPPAPGADPLAPPTPGDPSVQPAAASGPTPAGQNPEPFTGEPPFRPPTFDPPNGATVGVAKPIVINFAVPITDRGLAEQAIHISSTPAVPGKFYWINDKQVRWRPLDFWPAHTAVHIDAAGAISNFTTGDQLIGNIDNNTHQMTVTRNGTVEKTIPVSMGMAGDQFVTHNGTYYVSQKYDTIVMDSSTFGIPVNSPMGYKVNVQDAVRLSNTGIFVHSAPWSVADQGKRNVSHGCINISPENAKWFKATFNSGDPVIVKNSTGLYNQNDGYDDWQK